MSADLWQCSHIAYGNNINAVDHYLIGVDIQGVQDCGATCCEPAADGCLDRSAATTIHVYATLLLFIRCMVSW